MEVSAKKPCDHMLNLKATPIFPCKVTKSFASSPGCGIPNVVLPKENYEIPLLVGTRRGLFWC
jgi:hypothetical protein